MPSSVRASYVKHAPAVFTGLLVLSGVVVYQLNPAFGQFLRDAWDVLTSDDEPRITRWVEQFGWRGPLLIVAAMIAQIFLVVIPSWGLMVVAVLAYGPVWGALLSLGASALAAAVAYVVGKYVGDVVVRELVGEQTERRLEDWFRRYGFGAVALARVSPFISGDAVSLIGGISEMNFGKFMLATILGVAPLTMAVGYFGQNTAQLRQGFVWLTALSVGLFGLYLLYNRFWRQRG